MPAALTVTGRSTEANDFQAKQKHLGAAEATYYECSNTLTIIPILSGDKSAMLNEDSCSLLMASSLLLAGIPAF